MMKEIWLVRHAETELNRRGIVQGSGVDSDLNATGWEQARRFHQRYHTQTFDLLLTSRLRRTHQTMEGFISAGLPWQQTADINEISWGTHEGQPHTPDKIVAYEAMIASWGRGELEASLPRGESAAQLIERCQRFLHTVLQAPEERVLVCSHGRTIRCLVTLLKALPPAAMETVHHSNTGLFHARVQSEATQFLLENDLSHLHE